MIKKKNKPNYKIGHRMVYADKEYGALDDNMIIDSEPMWYPYTSHPDGGYWEYSIVGKANNCPAELLVPYVEGKDSYDYRLDLN